MAARRRRIVTTNRLMAVVDQPEAAAAATSALVRAGFAPGAVTVLQGDEDADRLDSRGKGGGRWARAWHVLSFTVMDQRVDLVVYEAALRDGRAVVAVHARDAEEKERAKCVLAAAGAHFMNFFGRIATEDVSPWRGKELPIPAHLRR
jgi:hypothetical protein